MPTPIYGFRYPASTDTPDGPTQMQNLALDVEGRINTMNTTLSGLSGVQAIVNNNTLTCAFVRNTSVQSLSTAGQNYMLTFNAKDIDTHSAQSGTRYTAPRAGKYVVTGGFACNAASAGIQASVYKNGGAVTGSANRVFTSSGGNIASVEANLTIVTLNSGDYVEIGASSSVGSTNTDASTWPPHMFVVRLPD
jgi:hypothetical protein